MCLLRGGHSSHKISCPAKQAIVTFQCQLCDYKSPHRQNLNAHMKKHEDGHLSFICDVQGCRKAFKTLELLDKHKVKYHKQYYSCNQCDKQFTDSKRRDNHVKTHSKTKIKCDTCEFECQYPSQLKQHQQKHKERPGPKLHKCSQCKYQSFRSSNFKRHVRLRHEPRPPTILSTMQMWEIISRRLISLNHGVNMFSELQRMSGKI